MGFHNVQLPTEFSAGSLFGPSFVTRILELDNMQEHRLTRGPVGGRRLYSLSKGIANLDSLYQLYEFFMARQGAANSFRLKDWLDYASTSTGSTHRNGDVSVAFDDQILVSITSTTYQLVKRYVSGGQEVIRTIDKPVSGTIKVGDTGGEITSGFTVNNQTGVVTFDSAPTAPVTGGYEFDVACRFEQDTESAFQIAIEALDTGSLGDIRCIEDVNPAPVSQDFNFGGAINHGAFTADIQISELDGRLQRFESTTASLSILLPDETNLAVGGPYFLLANEGTQSLVVKDSGGSTIVGTFATGKQVEMWLALDSDGTTKIWLAFEGL